MNEIRVITISEHDLERRMEEMAERLMEHALTRYAGDLEEIKTAVLASKGIVDKHGAGRILGGVTAETVMKYVREDGLPVHRAGANGKAPLFLLDDLIAWLRNHRDCHSPGALPPPS